MEYKKGLFVFHRDFRINDNTGLIRACEICENVHTLFIFTPTQVTNKNSYKSDNCVQFMIESLIDLQKQMSYQNATLLLQYGDTTTILSQIISTLNIDCLFFNKDLTPYARQRTDDVEQLCKSIGIDCKSYHDYYLSIPGEIMTNQDTMYHIFTPFYEKMTTDAKINKPNKSKMSNLAKYTTKLKNEMSLQDAMETFVGVQNEDLSVRGGRILGNKRLQFALKTFDRYYETRDIMSIETTLLSAYIKFGCLSIREIYHAFVQKFGKFHELVRQIIWRDFYAFILYFYPDNLGKLYHDKMNDTTWSKSKLRLKAWKTGNTGVPLIDAGMRQLNCIGYMHNRARMLTASYLVKILHIDWREGEKYFAQKLVDYDVASNSGNWQAIVGGGVYSMPWFRIMSPWAQSAQYDKDALYIKKWVDELQDIPPKCINKWYKYCKESPYTEIYRCPIVEYKKERLYYIDKFK
jgi:deoxyribodipyrimidine photo-lyase